MVCPISLAPAFRLRQRRFDPKYDAYTFLNDEWQESSSASSSRAAALKTFGLLASQRQLRRTVPCVAHHPSALPCHWRTALPTMLDRELVVRSSCGANLRPG